MNREKETPQQDNQLRREIGAFGGFNILTGIMVGSGIFYLGSYVLMRSGMSQGLALLVWVLGGLITLISGLCYAELGAAMPETGGRYIYLRKAYGKIVAFMSGASGFVLGSCGSISAIALASAGVCAQFLTLTTIQVKMIAIAIIIILTIINYCGVKLGSVVQNIFTIAKLTPIILILGLGIFGGTNNVDLSIVPASGPSMGEIIQMTAYAVLATFWAYEGWTNLNVIAGEIKNPKKNLPLAITTSIIVVAVIYVLFNFSIYRVLSMEEIVASFDNGSLYLGTVATSKMIGNIGETLVTATMLIAMIGAVNGCVLVFPRSLFSMSNDGTFFKYFGKVHPKYNTPSNAIILTAIISILLVFSQDLNQLTTLVTFSGLIFNGLIFVSIYLFRKREPNMERPYKVWGYPFTPGIAALVMLGMIINTFYTNANTSLLGLAVTVGSLILYFIYDFLKKKGIE